MSICQILLLFGSNEIYECKIKANKKHDIIIEHISLTHCDNYVILKKC